MSLSTDSSTVMQAISTETVTPIPTRDEIIALIQRDALEYGIEVDNDTAAYIDDMFGEVARVIRNAPLAKVYILSRDDMLVAHPVLDHIMVDDVVVVKPGSAHDGLNLRHLEGSELTFVHTTAEGRGVDRYCAVVIAIDSTTAA